MWPGGRIEESFYDFEAQRIGPYEMNITLPYAEDANGSVPIHFLYERLLEGTALAVCDVDGVAAAVIFRDHVEVRYVKDFQEDYIMGFNKAITRKRYEPIGWVKTYPKNWSCYHYPWALLRDVETHEVLDFPGVVLDDVTVSPSLMWYVRLRDSDKTAIYVDLDGREKFL